MCMRAQRQIFFCHSVPVIPDTDPVYSAAFNFYVYGIRA